MTTWISKSKNVTLYHADCREVELSGVTAVVTDPPYGLKFMGKGWDHGVPGQSFWELIARACLPGAPLLAFGGSRTFHRLACAIEDAGWELRDTIMWLYGSGFPKSLDVSKAIDKAAGAERERIRDVRSGVVGSTYAQDAWTREYKGSVLSDEPIVPAAKLWHGYGTSLKPAFEPVTVAMKPMGQSYAANAIEHGVAGLNVDGGRIGTGTSRATKTGGMGRKGASIFGEFRHKESMKLQTNKGRWPANVIHDGSPEVLAGMPEVDGGKVSARKARPRNDGIGLGGNTVREGAANAPDNYGDSGSAARFFYCAKASKAERSANWKVYNTHATVKPLALMRYLLTLVTMPERNLILDPFMGSGSTGVACVQRGLPFIGIEKDKESFEIARDRIKHTRVK